jgi:hypothetical protein
LPCRIKFCPCNSQLFLNVIELADKGAFGYGEVVVIVYALFITPGEITESYPASVVAFYAIVNFTLCSYEKTVDILRFTGNNSVEIPPYRFNIAFPFLKFRNIV